MTPCITGTCTGENLERLVDFIKESADHRALTGWVRKEDDRIRFSAEGSEDILTTFLAGLQGGSPTSELSALSVEWGQVEVPGEHFLIQR